MVQEAKLWYDYIIMVRSGNAAKHNKSREFSVLILLHSRLLLCGDCQECIPYTLENDTNTIRRRKTLSLGYTLSVGRTKWKYHHLVLSRRLFTCAHLAEGWLFLHPHETAPWECCPMEAFCVASQWEQKRQNYIFLSFTFAVTQRKTHSWDGTLNSVTLLPIPLDMRLRPQSEIPWQQKTQSRKRKANYRRSLDFFLLKGVL